jgi:ABC-type Fe3+ transport system permease subunit
MALSSFFSGHSVHSRSLLSALHAKKRVATVGTRGISLRPMMVGQWRYIASGICLLCSALWIILPMLMLIIGSFMRLYGFFSVKAPFTFQHWLSALRDPLLLVCLKNSLVIALGVGIFGLTIYAVIAYVIVRNQVPGRAIISILAWLPWAVPGILLGVALALAAAVAARHFAYLRHLRSVDPGFDHQRDAHRHPYDENRAGTDLQELEEASLTCGAGRCTTSGAFHCR